MSNEAEKDSSLIPDHIIDDNRAGFIMDPLHIRLARLRRRLRLVIALRGICLLLSIVLATVIVAGWIDWRLPGHLPSLVRAFILVTTLSAGGLIGYRFLLGPLFRRADDLSLAL